jgi:perosamine synthetase
MTHPTAGNLSGITHLKAQVELAEPDIGDRERKLVWTALESPEIAYGATVTRFEDAVTGLMGREHAIGLSSGTAVLHLALLAVGVRPDEEVLLPTLTFIAPANAVRYVGAHPVLFDVEDSHRQLDVGRLADWLERECRPSAGGLVRRSTGRRIGAVLPVDLLGHPCDVDALREVVGPFELPIVDDAAESLGAELRGRPVGAAADVACLSFNANKIVTSGGGGMLLTDSEPVAARVRYLATQAKAGKSLYVHDEVGFNYGLASAQAALGYGQLQRLGEFLERKAAIARHYAAALAGVPGISLPSEAPWASCTNWLYAIHVDPDAYGADAGDLQARLARENIVSRRMFGALHRQGAHLGCEAHPCPVAERLAESGLMLPSGTKLTTSQLDRVVDVVVGGRHRAGTSRRR